VSGLNAGATTAGGMDAIFERGLSLFGEYTPLQVYSHHLITYTYQPAKAIAIYNAQPTPFQTK